MDFLSSVTPIVITWNEEDNLPRVLERLTWAREILVIDSGSSDRTLELLAGLPAVRVLTRPFTSFSDQWNFALGQVGSEWVMTLDADYVLSLALVEELRALRPSADTAGYFARFVYCSLGRPLRGSLYPPRAVLFRRALGSFEEEGHQQRLGLRGRAEHLGGPIYHDDLKPLSRWLVAQERYASLEAGRLLTTNLSDLEWRDRIRRVGMLAAPLAMAYSLVGKGCLLDGRAGLYYAFQRGIAEAILALKLWEARSAGHPSRR